MQLKKYSTVTAVILLLLATVLSGCGLTDQPVVSEVNEAEVVAVEADAADAVAAAEEIIEEDAPAITGYANPDVLVDTAWVKAHLTDSTVRLLDVSASPDVFEAGHLPGAQFVNWKEELTSASDPVRGQILEQEALSDLLSNLGINKNDTIVFYDDTNNLFATRAYWALKYYQHPDVRVYNGGSAKWVAEGNALSTELATVEPSTYEAGEADPAIRTTWEYVVEHTADPGTLFCDTRSVGEFTGVDARAEKGGHIPGAILLEWTEAVNDDGTFRDAATLAALYQDAGFTPDKEIITYCQTGVRGAHTWFVLKELLGYENVRNYDGSWEEYGNNPESEISLLQ